MLCLEALLLGGVRMTTKTTISKKLTRNDLGTTGSHQAGICVPINIIRLNFFPSLDSSQYNPRKTIPLLYKDKTVFFNLIYYNNRLFGKGTRNEYRLTGMTRFLKENDCKENDTLEFSLCDGKYYIDIIKQHTKELNIDAPIYIKSDWAYKESIS